MPVPDPSLLARLLSGEAVFESEMDKRLLEAATSVTARGTFELWKRCDTDQEDWLNSFLEQLEMLAQVEPYLACSYDDENWPGIVLSDEYVRPTEVANTEPRFYYKLEFTNEDAAYYQFHYFPPFDQSFITGAAKKREGVYQHLMVELESADDRVFFEQSLRSNPHIAAIQHSDEESFNKAPSNAV